MIQVNRICHVELRWLLFAGVCQRFPVRIHTACTYLSSQVTQIKLTWSYLLFTELPTELLHFAWGIAEAKCNIVYGRLCVCLCVCLSVPLRQESPLVFNYDASWDRRQSAVAVSASLRERCAHRQTDVSLSSLSTRSGLCTTMCAQLRGLELGADSTLGQLNLLPSAGREMSTGQSAVMLCGWGVKAGMVHSTCG